MRSQLIQLTVALALLAAASVYLGRRGTGESRKQLATLSVEFPIATPTPPIVSMDLCEDLSEEVSRTLLALSEALRRREWRGIGEYFSPVFRAADWSALQETSADELPLGVHRATFAPEAGAPAVGVQEFVRGIRQRVGEWEQIDAVALRFDRADFQAGKPTWGRVHLIAEWTGSAVDLSARSLVAEGWLKVAQAGSRWYLHAFELQRLETCHRSRRVFTEVTKAAGMYCNDAALERHMEAWNGCACGDLDGDGLLDLFVPGTERNYLYVAAKGGGYRDEAAARGVQLPAAGPAPSSSTSTTTATWTCWWATSRGPSATVDARQRARALPQRARLGTGALRPT
jgi:hypothetical protein